MKEVFHIHICEKFGQKEFLFIRLREGKEIFPCRFYRRNNLMFSLCFEYGEDFLNYYINNKGDT